MQWSVFVEVVNLTLWMIKIETELYCTIEYVTEHVYIHEIYKTVLGVQMG